jgi:adenine-specific DNA-methyltransferase
LLWLASGARAPRPKVKPGQKFLISPECGYAVLLDDAAFRDFDEALSDEPEISHVFLITDSEEAYAEMRERLGPARKTMLLYRDFLRHYRRRRIQP